MTETKGGSKSLATTIADRLRASALVVIVQEQDEALAVSACRAAAKPFTGLAKDRITREDEPDIRFFGAASEEVMGEITDLPTGKGVVIVSDFFALYGDNPVSARMVREVALQQLGERAMFSRLILVESPATTIPAGVAGDVEVITVPLPGVVDLQEELDAFTDMDAIEFTLNDDDRYRLASAVAGVSRHEAARLFSRCFVELDMLDAAWLRVAKAEKVAGKLGGALSFESSLSSDVGGMLGLKEWCAVRMSAFGSAAAKAFGLPEPKGCMLLGVPGCGKSLTAKTIARVAGLPLLRLDVGKVMAGLVGASEGNMRAAIEAAEACAPCVLWVDEIEKGLAGAGGGGASDGGTSTRVFGTLLTWLQEKTAPVFVVATANRIADLPPELLRKGRFDEIFFVGLPTLAERKEIAMIHLARRPGTDAVDAVAVAKATDGYSGAEIEQAVVDGLFSAFADGKRKLTTEDVLTAVRATSPISNTMKDEIDALEKWAEGRARPAAGPAPTKSTTTTRVRRGPALTKKGR